ncbi:serine hydrolase [Brevibacillus reuszeri]|uniref:serine hydrolase n=1 Tax=Brevibacillus reuszeri TaxID=54915 RepID=UPI000CCC3DE1|nr:serine hydrolase [Brevibacillus reuszeri]
MKKSKLEQTIQELAASIDGRVAVFIEWDEGRVSLNEQEAFPSASLIKIPIMLEALRQEQVGQTDLNTSLAIPAEERVGGMGVLADLSSEIQLPLRDLVTLMIAISDNTATNLVIQKVTMEAVNQLAAGLGCQHTVLARKMMDTEAVRQGKDNYTSAQDIGLLLKEIITGDTLDSSRKEAAFQMMRQQQFHTKLPAYFLGELPPDASFAHKTGELAGIEHDAGILKMGDRYITMAVLTRDLADEAAGREFIAKVGKAVFDTFYQRD